jgi:hypothetical protein
VLKLLSIPPFKDNHLLKWVKKDFNDGQYIGQINKDGNFHGRGCHIIYNEDPYKSPTYIGYYKNGKKSGKGLYYDSSLTTLIYEGYFKNDLMDGLGVYYFPNGNKYDGWFDKGKKHGKGVFYWGNFAKWEGSFINDEFSGIGIYIHLDTNNFETVIYENNNIISKSDFVNCDEKERKRMKKMVLKELSKDYPYYMDLIQKSAPFENDIILSWVNKNTRDGVYIGQVNTLGQYHGLGVLINTATKRFHVGYFENGRKEGFGKEYYREDCIYYEGNFRFDSKCGKGTYFNMDNTENYVGNFNEIGTGFGVYYWKNGSHWKGYFYNHKLHGVGRKFNKDGDFLGTVEYFYNN